MRRGEIRWYTFALPDKRRPVLLRHHLLAEPHVLVGVDFLGMGAWLSAPEGLSTILTTATGTTERIWQVRLKKQ
jgi:hypothetical protein